MDLFLVPTPDRFWCETVASGVCHTDLHAVDGDWPVKPKLPFIPGHEGVGYVAAVGSDVTVVKEGDRVGVPWLHSACGMCEFCLTGWETLCPQQQNTGYSVDGGFAEYVLAPANYVGHIPVSLEATDAAPILCAGVTTYKGLKETDTKPGDWVVIVGVGGLGHVAVQYAKAMGLHVAAVDVSDDKLALAKRLGAELTVHATVAKIRRPRFRIRSVGHMGSWSRPCRQRSFDSPLTCCGGVARACWWVCHRATFQRRYLTWC